MGQPVVPVVPESRRGVRSPTQQSVQRGGSQHRQPVAVGRRQCVDLDLHRLEQPGGGLAGRGGQCDPKPRPAVQFGLLGQQRQQSGDGGGLAGAGSPGQHGQRPRQRDLRGAALLGVGIREEPFDVGP